MLKKELILRNPLRQLGFETEDILPAGAIGAVLAHAGVGKTALLVQLALNGMPVSYTHLTLPTIYSV